MRQKGVLKLIGTYDDFTFYQQGDKFFARKKSSISTKKFREAECFEKQRRNAREFAGFSRLCSEFRKATLWEKKGLHDRTGRGVLMGILSAITRMGEGSTGTSPIRLRKFGYQLVGYNFLEESKLERLLRAPYSVSVNQTRNEVSVHLTNLRMGAAFLSAPGDTHCVFTLSIGTISDKVYNEQMEKYVPLHPEQHGVKGKVIESTITLNGVQDELTLTSSIEKLPELHDEVALVVVLGVKFASHGKLTGRKAVGVVGVY